MTDRVRLIDAGTVKRFCAVCGGHVHRHDLTSSPPKYRWSCDEGCTTSALMLKGAPFPKTWIRGGPRP